MSGPDFATINYTFVLGTIASVINFGLDTLKKPKTLIKSNF